MTELEILQAARCLILLPEHWTQQTSARNRNGKPTHINSPNAMCWCASGALKKVVPGVVERGGAEPRELNAARLTLHDHHNWFGLAYFNDTHAHGEVITLFDRAITSILSRPAQPVTTITEPKPAPVPS